MANKRRSKKLQYLPISSKEDSADPEIDDDEHHQTSIRDFRISSKWDSRFFHVQPKTPSDNEFELSQYFDVYVDRRTRQLVIPIFIITITCVLSVWILALLDVLQAIIALLVIVALTWFASFVGMIGVYKWGSVEGMIEFFSRKNNEFDEQIQVLQENKSKVKGEAKLMHYTVGKLKQHGKELQMHLKEFDELRISLEQMVSDNQGLTEMLDEINKQIDDWHRLIFENERAGLLSIYYECSFRDGQEGLSKDEYQRFLGKLNEKTRREFELQGGFLVMDKDGSGIVDLYEFMDMVYGVLESVQHDAIKQYKDT